MGCSTELHPTKEFILGHADRYEDWSPYTGLVPVNSEIVIVIYLAFAVLAVLSCFLSVRSKRFQSCFSAINPYSRRGYINIPVGNNISQSSNRNENGCIQMT